VEEEPQNHQGAVADFVGEERQHNDGDAETGEAATGDGAQFRLGEAVLPGPIPQAGTTDGESDARGDEGHEAGNEKAPVIGADHNLAGWVLRCCLRGHELLRE